MNPEAMHPFGIALVAYSEGETDAELLIRRDDNLETPLPISHFFRAPATFSPQEMIALEQCRGHILDIGAGTGMHSRVLQKQGLTVTALDICPEAVRFMVHHDITTVIKSDIFVFKGGPFDTLLMLGHGIGMVENIEGLIRFLSHARTLIRSDGQILIESLDGRKTVDPVHLAYHELNLRNGRYFGQTRIRLVYHKHEGPWYGWLHIDPQSLGEHAEKTGWVCETLSELDNGEYLARLAPAKHE